MRLYLLVAVLLFSLTCCFQKQKGNPEEPDKAQQIVDSSIAAHGGNRFKNVKIDFDFRERHYQAIRKDGEFTYTRSFTDSTGQVVDILNNNGFIRKINGKVAPVTPEKKTAYSESVNSVIYFALLPFGLNDPAVRKTYLGIANIGGQPYHKIKVTFAQEGGGADYQDTYVYWLHPEKFTMDYLAYSYHTDEAGLRFRKAINPVTVEGIRFQNYINYEPNSDTVAVASLDKLYNTGQLKELSRIELQNIKVKPL